jgi:hypothetical protein
MIDICDCASAAAKRAGRAGAEALLLRVGRAGHGFVV